jgi:hypothetical protein
MKAVNLIMPISPRERRLWDGEFDPAPPSRMEEDGAGCAIAFIARIAPFGFLAGRSSRAGDEFMTEIGKHG